MKYIITESQYNLLTESLSPEVRRRLPFENLMNDMEWGVLDSMNPCDYEDIGEYISNACDSLVEMTEDYFMNEFHYVLEPREKDSLYYFFVDYFKKFLLDYRKKICIKYSILFFGMIIVKLKNKKLMKKFILLLFLVFTLGFSSCGNYQNVSSQPRITHILAVNELGQQVQVPLSSFTNELDPYYYNNWRFYWRNNWYYGYNWWFYFDDPFWRPRIHNYYYSYPVYYNHGYRVARNNGYRGRENYRTETPSVRPQQGGRTETPSVRPQRTETPSVRPQREYRPETPSVRPQSGGRTSSGRRG